MSSKREKVVTDGHVTAKHVTHPHGEEKREEPVPEVAAGSKRKAEEHEPPPASFHFTRLSLDELLKLVTRALDVKRTATADSRAGASGSAGVAAVH